MLQTKQKNKQFLYLKQLSFLVLSIFVWSHYCQAQTYEATPPVDIQFEDGSTRTIHRCASVHNHLRQIAENPEMESLEEFEGWLNKKIAEDKANNHGKSSAAFYTIPVIVHIIHNNGEAIGSGRNISAAQVQAQIDVLNEDFRKILGTPGHNTHPDGADVEIEFCLAQVDENGNPLAEPGIHRVNAGTMGWGNGPYETGCPNNPNTSFIDNTIKPTTIWDTDRYLNMWTLEFNCLLGYAQFPSSSGLGGLNTNGGAANTDGVVMGYTTFGSTDKGNFPVMQFPYNKGRTATHEVGHWLGLRHIWGDATCGNDFCNDTPTQQEPNYNACPNETTCDGNQDLTTNYMDYCQDACMNIFTEDQKTRMQTVMQNSPRRGILSTNAASICNISPDVNAEFTADVTTICPGQTVTFTDQSTGTPAVNSWSWAFTGGTPASSSAQNPAVVYNTAGTYQVSLTASNGSTNDTETKTAYITVGTPTGETLPYAEDVENTGAITWGQSNPDDDNIQWALATALSGCAGNGSNSFVIDNATNDSRNTEDFLINTFDLTNASSPITLTFDLAYARWDNTYWDGLSILVADACSGNALGTVYDKESTVLATVPDQDSAFAPDACGDWRNETVDLSAYAGQVIDLVFVNSGGWGNNIYVDNLNITSTNCTPVTWYADTDSDGFGDPNNTQSACTQPAGFVSDNTDCDDTNGAINPNATEVCDGVDNNCSAGITDENPSTWYADTDSDGFGDPNNSQQACTQPAGFVSDNTDCDDTNGAINPNATEVCDGVDNNCSAGITDENPTTWYADADSDGFGDPNNSQQACTQPAGFVSDNTDCDDTNANVNPNAPEVCDGVDNNCVAGTTDETASTWYADTDSDGFGDPNNSQQACAQPTGFVSDNTDCDDTNGAINPNATEVCDGVDNNCVAGTTDETTSTWYADTDSDGFGDPNNSQQACTQPAGFVSDNTDCDDTNANVNPNAPEVCDGVDNNCVNGISDEAPIPWYADTDNDGFGDPNNSQVSCNQPAGFVANDQDCDDTNTNINPNSAEVCDNVDNNCSGFVDDGDACLVVIELRIFLAGAYQSSGQMSTALKNSSTTNIPNMNPYTVAPWNHAPESVSSNNDISTLTVDWVLIELIDPTTFNTVAKEAGFLMEDGSVTDLDGVPGVAFPTASYNENYYIVVRHRNHLDVVSTVAITVDGQTFFDFTDANNIMGGTSQVKALPNGKYGLCAGDMDGNGVINVTDFNDYVWELQNNSSGGYSNYGDIDLNGVLNVDDFNRYITNASRIGVNIVRY